MAAIASGVLLVSLDSQLSFFADDWAFLTKRRGWSIEYLLDPYHGHLVAGLGIAFNLMRETFGMGSATPYFVIAIACFLASAIALFFYLRSRVGDWLALCGAVLILFMGAAFEDLFFAFQLGFFVSAIAGLGALIALDREDETGDLLACILLTVSLAFATIGIPFVTGALVKVLLGRGLRGWHLYVPLVPIVLYGLWWIGWGHQAHTNVTGERLLNAPGNAFDAAAAGVVSLLGLASGYASGTYLPDLTWGRLLLVVGMALLAIKIVRDRGISVGLATALAIGITYWVLLRLNRDISSASRYQYPSAIFLLLIVGEMLRGIRVPRAAVVGVAVVTGFAVISGISLMQKVHDEQWRPFIDSQRSHLAAVDLARPATDPDFVVRFPPPLEVSVGTYYAAIEDHGSPALTEAELQARPEEDRAEADVTMATALGLEISPPNPGTETIGCQKLEASGGGETGITLLGGGFTLENQGAAAVDLSLGRFSEGLPVNFGPLAPSTPVSLYIPEDESDQPWRLGLVGSGPVRLCTTG
jgi:hypothetical protein